MWGHSNNDETHQPPILSHRHSTPSVPPKKNNKAMNKKHQQQKMNQTISCTADGEQKSEAVKGERELSIYVCMYVCVCVYACVCGMVCRRPILCYRPYRPFCLYCGDPLTIGPTNTHTPLPPSFHTPL